MEQLDLLSEKPLNKIVLEAHPFIIAYLKSGFPSFHLKWMFRNRIHLLLKTSNTNTLLEYTFYNSKGQRILFN